MENPNNLHQFAERYLKFNEYGMPDYFFDFDAKTRTFTRFRQLSNRELTSVELPVWDVPSAPVPAAAKNATMLATLNTYHDRLDQQPRLSPLSNTGCEEDLATYAHGGVTIAKGCFKGHHRLQVVVPADYAVRLNAGCFDDDAQIDLVVPADMDLQDVYHSHDAGFFVDHDHWTVLAHRDFAFQGVCGKDGYHLSDFDPQFTPYQLTVSHPRPKLSTCLINTHQAVHAKVADDLSALANHWLRVHTDLHANLHDLRTNLHADLKALHQNLHGNLQELHQKLQERLDTKIIGRQTDTSREK